MNELSHTTRARPEFWFRSGPVPVPVEYGPVAVDLAGTRPVPRFFFIACSRMAKRTVENIYIV